MIYDRFPITPEGYKRLDAELVQLKSVDRPAIIHAIAEAREHGDLSENAEYSAAKESQALIEARIADLESRFSRAEVIDPQQLTGEKIVFGATAHLLDEDTDENVTYKIVSDYEADLSIGYISYSSPVAKAILSKMPNDAIEVQTPKGVKYYKVIRVEFI